jgi:hypothetical protein
VLLAPAGDLARLVAPRASRREEDQDEAEDGGGA